MFGWFDFTTLRRADGMNSAIRYRTRLPGAAVRLPTGPVSTDLLGMIPG